MNRKLLNIKIRTKNILYLLLVGIILFGIFITPINTEAASYTPSLNKGTKILEIKTYNKTSWMNVVNSFGPDEWFGENSNITGARSKVTTVAWYFSNFTTFRLFTEFMLSEEEFLYLLSINMTTPDLINFTKNSINSTYPREYETWTVGWNKLNYSTGILKETDNKSSYFFPIFRQPAQYRSILDDYNNWTAKINQILNSSGMATISNYTEHDFLWKLIFDGLRAPKPTESYLSSLINGLNCCDIASVMDNT
ncbi:MAG: hypothetical protein EU549_01765, partial [Promethearchaeota archaeon]